MTDSASRRTFIAATGMAAAHVWVPGTVRGYCAAEMRAMEHEVPGFPDVPVGSYLFMDMQHFAIGNAAGGPVSDDFARSLTVLATVLNNRFPGRLTTAAGAKALTLNVPRAGVVGEPGMADNAGSDEFGVITFSEARKADAIGDALELVVPHCDPVVNLCDQMYGIRKDRVGVV